MTIYFLPTNIWPLSGTQETSGHTLALPSTVLPMLCKGGSSGCKLPSQAKGNPKPSQRGAKSLEITKKWYKMLAHLQGGKRLNDRWEGTEPPACARFLAEAFQSVVPAPKQSWRRRIQQLQDWLHLTAFLSCFQVGGQWILWILWYFIQTMCQPNVSARWRFKCRPSRAVCNLSTFGNLMPD